MQSKYPLSDEKPTFFLIAYLMLHAYSSTADIRVSHRLLVVSPYSEEGDNIIRSFFYTATIKSHICLRTVHLSVDDSICFSLLHFTLMAAVRD